MDFAVDSHVPSYVIYRNTLPGEPYDPTAPPVFFPPKDSDELFDALRAKFTHAKTHSERTREAMIEFLLEERQLEQTAIEPQVTPLQPQVASPWQQSHPSMSSGTSSWSSPDTFNNYPTPGSEELVAWQPSRQQSEPQGSAAPSTVEASPPALEQMTGVFSLSESTQPKQHVRRKMTAAEKIEYRKRRIVRACEKCAKRKRKCNHNQPELNDASEKSGKSMRASSASTSSRARNTKDQHPSDLPNTAPTMANPAETSMMAEPIYDAIMNLYAPEADLDSMFDFDAAHLFHSWPGSREVDWTHVDVNTSHLNISQSNFNHTGSSSSKSNARKESGTSATHNVYAQQTHGASEPQREMPQPTHTVQAHALGRCEAHLLDARHSSTPAGIDNAVLFGDTDTLGWSPRTAPNMTRSGLTEGDGTRLSSDRFGALDTRASALTSWNSSATSSSGLGDPTSHDPASGSAPLSSVPGVQRPARRHGLKAQKPTTGDPANLDRSADGAELQTNDRSGALTRREQQSRESETTILHEHTAARALSRQTLLVEYFASKTRGGGPNRHETDNRSQPLLLGGNSRSEADRQETENCSRSASLGGRNRNELLVNESGTRTDAPTSARASASYLHSNGHSWDLERQSTSNSNGNTGRDLERQRPSNSSSCRSQASSPATSSLSSSHNPTANITPVLSKSGPTQPARNRASDEDASPMFRLNDHVRRRDHFGRAARQPLQALLALLMCAVFFDLAHALLALVVLAGALALVPETGCAVETRSRVASYAWPCGKGWTRWRSEWRSARVHGTVW